MYDNFTDVIIYTLLCFILRHLFFLKVHPPTLTPLHFSLSTFTSLRWISHPQYPYNISIFSFLVTKINVCIQLFKVNPNTLYFQCLKITRVIFVKCSRLQAKQNAKRYAYPQIHSSQSHNTSMTDVQSINDTQATPTRRKGFHMLCLNLIRRR